jgi:manganese/zinc/iron transport system substrate-binding protein
MRFYRRVLLSFVMAILAAPSFAMDRLNVVATTGMIADAARQVGGDLVDVKGLMGPGVDPHAYRQTRTDIVAMTRADLVLWHGLYLEAQMEDFFTELSAKRNVVEVAAGLDTSLLRGHDDYDDKFDPHVWMNPDIWALIVEQVQSALTATQPESADVFAANAQEHLAEIDRLSGYTKSALASVPEQSRVMLSAHDAFGYFGEAYGFEVLGIQGISTESEAGLKRISELVDLLVARDIRAVFVETSVSDRSMRAVIEGAAAKGHTVSIGGELFSDAMGEDGTYEGTYVGMIDHNATVITNALGGDAPLRGLNNKLSAGS